MSSTTPRDGPRRTAPGLPTRREAITVAPHPGTAGPEGRGRTSGVEEELLLVDAETLQPAAVGRHVVRAALEATHR